MPQKYYLPYEEVKLAEWMDNFGPKIATHGPTLGLTAPEIADAQARCAFGAAAIRLRTQVSVFAQDVTRFKRAALWAEEPTTAWPSFAMPMMLPPVTTAGVVPWLTLLVGRLKRHTAYTKAIGEELLIEGADQAALAPAAMDELKPVLKSRLATGGQPLLVWSKKGLPEVTGIELWVDRGDGKGFVFLATDSVPDYLDTYGLPAAGTSAVWKYKAIYKQGDNPVGQWSDILNVSVLGS
jgi:hypothetical protein